MIFYWLGRSLQLVGLVLVPIALAGNLAELAGGAIWLDLKQMLLLAVLGMCIFYLGHQLQQRVRGIP
jgi:hypothetical protein